ncbi:MAG: hypothetical protein Q4E65_03240 [Clostridia bacterium]|nr:hypothetical protein [Clostridia bacterium]
MTKVIAIEGIDGSGKTVQFKRLAENLAARGFTVERREYPVYEKGFFGPQVGRFLSNAEGVPADRVDGKSMALWFALDRWEDLQDYKGDTDFLVINRYVLSNAVYQGIRDIDRGRPDIVDWVFELEYEHFHLPKADLFLFYDVAPVQAGQNVQKKGFRAYVGHGGDVYEQSESIQQRAREKYLAYARRRDDIAVVQCMKDGVFQSADAIAAQTLAVLEEKGIL